MTQEKSFEDEFSKQFPSLKGKSLTGLRAEQFGGKEWQKTMKY